MPSGAAHGGMLLHRRSLIAVYLAFGALASFRRRHQGSVFAIGLMRHSDEHAMEACQIGSRPGYQGYQACDKVQWFEDDVGSTVVVRCLQLIVKSHRGPHRRSLPLSLVSLICFNLKYTSVRRFGGSPVCDEK